VFDGMFEWVFHWLFLISYCVDLKQCGWINVHAQFNDGEPQRLKVRCLGVTLRGLKDELNEFNQGVNPGDIRRVESIIHLDRIKERQKRDEHVLGAHHVPVDRYARNVAEINWRYHQKFDSARRSWLGRECTFQLQQLSSSGWGNSNLSNDSSQTFTWKIKFLLGWFKWRYWSVKECTSFFWHLNTII